MPSDIQNSYDRVAKEYANHIYGELKDKPFDRKMLDWLIEKVNGTICDIGCGPGQIARYLHDHGATSCGVDLSPGMVNQARELNPGISFQQGNMLALSDITDGSYGGLTAFYSIIHIQPKQVPVALAEFKRILKPGGVVLMAFHIGNEVHHLDEWWGEKVSVDFIYYERTQMKSYLIDAGFQIDEAIERDPYPDVEVQTRRAYIFARKPGDFR